MGSLRKVRTWKGYQHQGSPLPFFNGKDRKDTIWSKHQCGFVQRMKDCEGMHQDSCTVVSHLG